MSFDKKPLCAAGCGEIATTCCVRSLIAPYCGKECQTAVNWPSHKGPCKAAAAAAAGGGGDAAKSSAAAPAEDCIKPSNILVPSAGICIADFGSLRSVAPVPSGEQGWVSSRQIVTSSSVSSPGSRTLSPPVMSPFSVAYRTEAFSSPERLQGKTFGHLADVWSVGVILSGAAKGIKFSDMASSPEAEDAWAGTESSSAPSPQLTDLISKAVTIEESSRPNAGALLNHPALAALDTASKVAASAGASAFFKVSKGRVDAQLEVIALALRALKTIGQPIDVETLSVNLARQLETPLDIVRASLTDRTTGGGAAESGDANAQSRLDRLPRYH